MKQGHLQSTRSLACTDYSDEDSVQERRKHQFSSVQDGIYALRKARKRSTPSLVNSTPSVSFQTVSKFSDWPRLFLVLLRKIVECFPFVRLSPPGDRCMVWRHQTRDKEVLASRPASGINLLSPLLSRRSVYVILKKTCGPICWTRALVKVPTAAEKLSKKIHHVALLRDGRFSSRSTIWTQFIYFIKSGKDSLSAKFSCSIFNLARHAASVSPALTVLPTCMAAH